MRAAQMGQSQTRHSDAKKPSLLSRLVRFWAVAALVIWATFAAIAHADTPTSTELPQPSEAVAADDDKSEPDAQTPKAEITKAPVKAVIAPIKNKLIATPEPNLSITVEGKAIENSVVVRNEDGHVFVRAEPIFTALDDDFEYNAEGNTLVVRRSQDGVVMELFTDTGLIKADGKAIGKLRIFGEVTPDSITLTPNAIAVLAGAKPKHDDVKGILHFELDARLRVASGFQLYINDQQLNLTGVQAKSVGPVLLLPLLPIAKELGHFVQVDAASNVIKIRRAQDSANFSIDLTTGLVKQGERPIGVSKDVTFIDSTNLLLPVSAVEALTGTNITVTPGTDRVDIRLDDRLTGAVAPIASVDAETRNEPFTMETLSFHTGLDTSNRLDATFRMKKFNGRLRYEIPDLPSTGGELQPSWLSLDYRHLNGAYGSIGDVSADHRQLDGVGLRHVKGASFTKETEKAQWSGVIGAPVNGTEAISADQSRVTFGGVAAGVRYASIDGWEAGVALKQDSLTDDQMVVLSAISGRLGQKQNAKTSWQMNADAGYFSGPAREKSADLRVSGSARRKISEKIDLDVAATYTGVEFSRSDLRQEALAQTLVSNDGTIEPDTTDPLVPDVRRVGLDQLSLSAGVQFSPRADIGFLKHPGIALRASQNRSGVTTGEGQGSTSSSVSLTASTGINYTNANFTADFTQYNQSFDDESLSEVSGQAFNVRGYQSVTVKDRDYTVRAQYTHSQIDGQIPRERFDIALGSQPFTFIGPKKVKVSVSPTLSAGWSPQGSSVNGGVIANVHSGELFGPKTQAQASLGVLQRFGGEGNQEARTFLTASIARKLRINKNLSLGLSYRNDLQGQQRVGLQLDGRYSFNEVRKYQKTQDGRGILKGRAFLDSNRDGVKQEDEPGISGAILRVGGSGRKLSLKTDSAGYFTIQNIDSGIHNISIDNRSLPLGFALSSDTMTRATIREGYITEISLPIVQRGQIRGFAFVDNDGDGEYQNSETRLEGARMRIVSVDDTDFESETVTTSFGQYAFDDLPAGDYRISIVKTNDSSSRPSIDVPVTVGGDGGEMLTRASIPAAPLTSDDVPKIELAKLSNDPLGPDETPPETGAVPDQQGPAPP